MRDRFLQQEVWDRMGVPVQGSRLADDADRRAEGLPVDAVLEDRAQLQEARACSTRPTVGCARSSPSSASSRSRTGPTRAASTTSSRSVSRRRTSRPHQPDPAGSDDREFAFVTTSPVADRLRRRSALARRRGGPRAGVDAQWASWRDPSRSTGAPSTRCSIHSTWDYHEARDEFVRGPSTSMP